MLDCRPRNQANARAAGNRVPTCMTRIGFSAASSSFNWRSEINAIVEVRATALSAAGVVSHAPSNTVL
jgi:hypothetical protein